jgi:oligopeptidase A
VLDSPELREVYNENLPKITIYFTPSKARTWALFHKYKALAASTRIHRLVRRAQEDR